ncbi:carbohydrate-binding protein [Sorangium cellulosum]|uniref:Carbohydrate-binding protein n=1 Tax=Sorangium cellulosum TaxID=56 RepID=A0A2L0F445_SORCE|nr:CapA family protein [Sorangium cellulosum]AUX46219.1 carbohydrate-binding protein [Sorangium cellulosum]
MARRPVLRRSSSASLSACAAVCVCLASADAAAAYRFEASEAAFDATYAATPIDLTGVVVDEAGSPIAGAEVTAIGWGSGAVNDGEIAFTDAEGAFTLATLARRSVLLRVEIDGYYSEIVPADLHRPLAEPRADTGAIVLTAQRLGRARILVGGDTMFGRRFVDSDEDGVEGEDGDLIRPATREADASAVLTFLRDVLSSADYTQVNLECPVTDNPATAHPHKSYTFFSYPETVRALALAGVDGVSLGNNHMYDYMEGGVSDTLVNVPNAGLDWFGAGLDETMAKGTVLYRTIRGVDVVFQGFNQLVNDGSTLPEYTLTASDGPPPKAGALALTATGVKDFMTADATGRFAIPVLHGGSEYSDYPTSAMRRRFTQLVQLGAGVVVAHHPHTVHGVGLYDAGAGPRFVFMSLGNMVFDQDIFETYQSYVAVLDIDEAADGSRAVHRVQLIPFQNEGYVPKLVSGAWLARTGRHVGHLSTTLPAAGAAGEAADGLTGAVVFPSGPRVAAVSAAAQYKASDQAETRTVPLASRSTGPLAHVRSSAADSLAGLRTSAAASCDYGREIMLYGDFEDSDVDDAFHEGSMWSLSEFRTVQNSVVRSGTGAMVFLRKSTSTSDVSTYMNNRIKFEPGRKLTLSGYLKGDNAGQHRIQVYWYTSGGTSLSNTTVVTRAAGTYTWERFTADLTPPSNAGSVRVYFRAAPPASGEATTYLDDVSLIEWEGTVADASAGLALATPNDWSFVRCTAASSSLASLGVTTTHRTYTLAPSTP